MSHLPNFRPALRNCITPAGVLPDKHSRRRRGQRTRPSTSRLRETSTRASVRRERRERGRSQIACGAHAVAAAMCARARAFTLSWPANDVTTSTRRRPRQKLAAEATTEPRSLPSCPSSHCIPVCYTAHTRSTRMQESAALARDFHCTAPAVAKPPTIPDEPSCTFRFGPARYRDPVWTSTSVSSQVSRIFDSNASTASLSAEPEQRKP